ncbi:MAG: VapE family protein [Rhodoferax sp.]|nr:VapE family protein [Rhodoferax sp.]
MANIEPSGKAAEPLALTDFRHTPGVITPEQRANLSTVVPWFPGWLVWDPERGNPNGTAKGKVPIDPTTGDSAKVNQPGTAGTFEQALQAIPEGGGIGVLMTDATQGIIALDFDHVVNADGSYSGLGQEVFNQFKTTYIELSPSGTGLRVFVLGQANTEHQRGGGVELYPAGAKRWLRVTGAVLKSTAGAVGACQSGIDWAVRLMLAGSPDKGSSMDVAGAGPSSASPASGGKLSIDQVLDRLGGYRGNEGRSVVEVQAAFKKTVKEKPSGELAKALALMAAGSEKSEHDYLVMCEAFRRGIGTLEDAAALLVMLATREKVSRKDYQKSTAENAAREVLGEIETLGFNRNGFRVQVWGNLPDKVKDNAPALQLPAGMADFLEESGESLVMGRGGRVDATPGNVKVILTTDPRTRGLMRFNEGSQDVERVSSWKVFDRDAAHKPGNLQDIDVLFVQSWLHRAYGLKLQKVEVMQGVEMAARAISYDPVGDRLRGLGMQWDKVPRVASWLRDYAMIDDAGCPDFVSAAGCCFLVGAVARALNPGCKFDTVLTIEGGGGGGKSTLFRILADAVGPDLFTDGIHDVTNPVHRVEMTEGIFIAEIAELAAFRRAADQEALKTVLSQTRDKVRKPYAMRPVEVLRRYVFAATTNNDQYLADPTGAMARRFHSVRTKATEQNPLDFVLLENIAPQLWAEAVRMYQAGHPTFIATSGAAWDQWKSQRGKRQETQHLEEEVNDLMVRIEANNVLTYDYGRGITRADAAKEIFTDEVARNDPRNLDRLTAAMKKDGQFERQEKWAGSFRWKMTPTAMNAARVMRTELASLTEK